MMRAIVAALGLCAACNASPPGSECAEAGGTCSAGMTECKLAPSSAQDCKQSSQENPVGAVCCAGSDAGTEGGD